MQRKKISILVVSLLFIALPILIFSLKQNLDNRSRASLIVDKLEAESGMGTGNTVIKQNSTASEGEYIQFGTKDKYEAIRISWEEYITGGEYDRTDPQLKGLVDAKIAGIVTKARENKNNLITNPNRTYLFADIPNRDEPNGEEGQGIDKTYARIETMAQAYAIRGAITDPQEKEEMYKSIKSSLIWLNNNWYNVDTCKGNNWTESGPCPKSLVYQVGIPTSLTTSIILIYDRLSKDSDADEFITKNMNAVERFYPNPRSNNSNTYYPRTEHDTAGNLAMATVPLLLRAGISTNEDKRRIALNEALKNYNEELLPYATKGDGLYRDGSFIQHDYHPYNMWYGAIYLNRIADLSIILNNSGILTSNPNKLYEWFKNAYQPLSFNSDSMDMVKGRTATYPRESINTNGTSVLDPEIKILSMLSGDKYNDLGNDILNKTGNKVIKSDLFSLIQTYKLTKNKNLNGEYNYTKTKIFPRMDKAVVIKPDYAFAFSMSSSRTYNFESINHDNKKGWYMSDGMIYFYNKIDRGQYNDWYWATIDKTRLPGTTVDRQIQLDSSNNYTSDNFDEKLSNYLSPKDFAGGTQLNNFIALGMILKSRLDVSAKKSYFVFDDELVALGSDIDSSSGKAVDTIVENRKIKDDNSNEFIVNNNPISETANTSNPKWAYLEGTGGYFFPSGGQLLSQKETRKGNWKQLRTKESKTMSPPKNYASMWLKHGENPVNEKYAYVFLPNMSKSNTISYSQNPDISILANGANVHAVKDNSSNTTSAIFWSSGNVRDIKSSGPSSIILQNKDNTLSISASDPTQNQDSITFEIDKNAEKVISKDEEVNVISLSPIKFTVSLIGARGKTFDIKFAQ